MLKIAKYLFKEDLENSCLEIGFFKDGSGSVWNLDCNFLDAPFRDESVEPEIIVQDVNTTNKNLHNYKGYHFALRNIVKIDEREDSVYIFEAYPMLMYSVKILDIDEEKAHIVCKGIAIEDGESKLPKFVRFKMDANIPVVVQELEPEE